MSAIPSLATNTTELQFTRNADWGNVASAKFCDVVGECSYQLQVVEDPAVGTDPFYQPTVYAPGWDSVNKIFTLKPILSSADDSVDWGHTWDYRIFSWNKGGYSDASALDRAKTYPGPYDVAVPYIFTGYHWDTNQKAGTPGMKGDQNYTIGIGWNSSEGEGMNYKWRYWNGTYTGYSEDTFSDQQNVSPGATYNNVVYARAANLLERPLVYQAQSSPGHATYFQSRAQCRSTPAPRWREHYEQIDPSPTSGFAADHTKYQHIFGTTDMGWDWIAPNVTLSLSSYEMTNTAGQHSGVEIVNTLDKRSTAEGFQEYSFALSSTSTKIDSGEYNATDCAGGTYTTIDDLAAHYPTLIPRGVAPNLNKYAGPFKVNGASS